MNPNQAARKKERELNQWTRIMHYHQGVCQNRGYGEGSGSPRDTEIRANYREMYFYLGLTDDRMKQVYRLLYKWTQRHGFPSGVQDRYEQPPQGKIRLIRMMADDSADGLSNAQVDNYVVVEEEFTGKGQGLNKYERFFEVHDAVIRHTNVLAFRLDFWIEWWDGQGNSPRERQVMGILTEARNSVITLTSLLNDITIRTRDQKGEDDTSVPELPLRTRNTKRRAKLTGGIYAINAETTTTENPSGGAPLGTGIDPVEWEPDVKQVRDDPPLGTDVT